MSRRACVVTAGHLSSCPRMLKSADALAGAGYQVRVVSVNSTPWATASDHALMAARSWAWTVVDYDRVTGRRLQVMSGARFRASQAIASAIGPARVPIAVAIRAYSRVHDELVRAVTSERADLVYGGTTGALAAVAESASRLGVPYGVDFEDFHSGEHSGAGAEMANTLAGRVARHVAGGASFITAGSPMIAEAYQDMLGLPVRAIHNTFPIAPFDSPVEREDGPLRLYWFSQTLGPGRGLEDVIRAIGEANVPIELHLRARPIVSYRESLQQMGMAVAPRMTLVTHDPLMPDEMVRCAQPYDAGLSCEEPTVLNRSLTLGNKIFTYLAAGVPVILSRTPAQVRLERDLGDAAFGYECGDASGLAAILTCLAADAGLRGRARAAARAVAARRWHWEHPDDRGALLAAVAGAMG